MRIPNFCKKKQLVVLWNDDHMSHTFLHEILWSGLTLRCVSTNNARLICIMILIILNKISLNYLKKKQEELCKYIQFNDFDINETW